MPLLLLIPVELFVDNDSVSSQVQPVYLGLLFAPQKCHGCTCMCGILPITVKAYVDVTE